MPTKTQQRRHRLGEIAKQLMNTHKPDDSDLTALADLFTTLAALEAETGNVPSRTRQLNDAIDTWIASQ